MAFKKTKDADQVPARQEAAEGPSSVAVPSFLGDRLERDQGKGTSQRQEDNLIPIIYILQANTPQAVRRNPAYIEGAEPGMIWLRNCVVPLISGEEGVAYQPCYFAIDYVEWIPRDEGGGGGGGFVGRHAALPEDARKVVDERNPNKVHWVRESNGNELIETRNHYGFILGGLYGLKAYPGLVLPYMIPLSSTGHTVSRSWMSLMNQYSGPKGEPAVSFSRYYHLKTKFKTNSFGEWFLLDPQDGGWVRSVEEYDRGLNLHNIIARGEMKPEAPVEREEEQEGDTAARAGI